MKALKILACSAVLCTLSCFPFASVCRAQTQEIKIGILLPLSGYIAYFGKMQEVAMKVAENEFKEKGPVGGFQTKLVTYDTASKPNDAILMAQKLMHTDKVVLIIGPYLSTEAEQVFPIVNKAQVPIVTASAAKPGLTKENRPWTFRNALTSDAINGPTIKSWVNNHKIKTVAILTDIKSKVCEMYGKGVAPQLLKENGVQVIESIDFVTEDVDFSAQITKVKNANPDGLVLAGDSPAAANIAREARKQGLKQPFLGDLTISSDLYTRLGGPSTEGTYSATDFWVDNPNLRVQNFVKEFQKLGRKDQIPHNTTAAFFDTLCITREIIGKVGLSGKAADLQKDREKIRDGWATLKNYQGGLTPTSMGVNGEVVKDSYTLVVKDGKWVRMN